jgi:hypothetical protein
MTEQDVFQEDRGRACAHLASVALRVLKEDVMGAFLKMTVITAGLLFLSSSAVAGPPNGTLSVAYRQLMNPDTGQKSLPGWEAVHHIHLSCWDGRCSLTTLSLNQCVLGAFYPKIERAATDDGDLTVTEIGPGILIAEQRLRAHFTTFKYRFGYDTRTDPDFSRQFGVREARYFKQLTSFSGAAVKQSAILEKVISWELVPLKGHSPMVEAKCKIQLDGVPD